VRAGGSFKKTTWITENGSHNRAGQSHSSGESAGGMNRRRQRPGLMSASRLNTALRWLWLEKPQIAAISARLRSDVASSDACARGCLESFGRCLAPCENALILQDAQIPPGSLVAGVPGKVRRELTDAERDSIRDNAEVYLHALQLHRRAVKSDASHVGTKGVQRSPRH